MNTLKLTRSISMACLLALAPLGAHAASPKVQDQATSEDTHSMVSVEASRAPKIATNGKSLNGRKVGGFGRSARRAGGRGAGMAVTSIDLPSTITHKRASNGISLNGRKVGGFGRSARRAPRGGAGMMVTSIELPSAARSAK